MNQYPRHTLPRPDAVPGWARLVLYIVAILAPFAGLALGRLTGEETIAAVVTLFGVIGPAVAVVYQKKQEDEDGAQFRQGYAAAVTEHLAPELHELPDESDPRR